MDESEEDVFGADVAVIQQPRFFLSQHHDSPGPVSEAFEHAQPFARGPRALGLADAGLSERPTSRRTGVRLVGHSTGGVWRVRLRGTIETGVPNVSETVMDLTRARAGECA